MKKMVMLVLLLSMYLCIIPVVAADCVDHQSLDYVAVPSQVPAGSDITFTLNIDGTSDYHYICWAQFFSLHTGFEVIPDSRMSTSSGNKFWGDLIAAGGPVTFKVKTRPQSPTGAIIGSWVSCDAYLEPGRENSCDIVIINPVYADSEVVGTPAPEFPSTTLPVIIIIGLLGTVFYIQRTREH